MKFFKALKKFYEYMKEESQSTEEHKTSNSYIQEPITLEIENPYVKQVKEWAVNKIELLHEADRHKNARALASEFEEWINIPEGTEKLEYFCIENEEWTDEQEIDVQ